MATTSELDERIERSLNVVFAELDDLPELVEEWEIMPVGERVSWSLEWDHAMGTYLTRLDHYFCLGEMSPAQQARYRDLLCRLKAALPLIERRNLYRPPVPLDR